MVTNRPYGDLAVLKRYCSNINLTDTTYNKLLDRAATNVEAAFKMGGTEFQTDYVYYNTIKDYVELKAACRAHMMYGRREDAAIYCTEAKELAEQLKIDDTALETEAGEGNIEPVEAETYPSNPMGTKLIGRGYSEWYNGVPTP